MNRWAVYEYMKQRYMRTGEVPSLKEVLTEFEGTDIEEIEEGMTEFQLAVPHIQVLRTTRRSKLADEILSAEEVAVLLDVSRCTIDHYVRIRKIRPIKYRPLLFLRSEIEKAKPFIERQRMKFRPYHQSAFAYQEGQL